MYLATNERVKNISTAAKQIHCFVDIYKHKDEQTIFHTNMQIIIEEQRAPGSSI